MSENERVSYGERIRRLARQKGGQTAIVFVPENGDEQQLTWSELDTWSNQACRMLQQAGLKAGGTLVIALPNSIEHVISSIAGWKAGALVLPLSFRMPFAEREQLLGLVPDPIVVGDWEGHALRRVGSAAVKLERHSYSDAPLPDVTPHPGKAIASGGSTGRPKVILDPSPWAFVPGETVITRWAKWSQDGTQLVTGPMYHNGGFTWGLLGLFEGQRLILFDRFRAEAAVEAVERYEVSCAVMLPIMMRRIALLPGIESRDLKRLHIMHSGAPCPPWLKRFWIDLVGPENVLEGFGATENIGVTFIRGDEWLEHPGSVGRPIQTDIKILDEDMRELPVNEVGEIFSRPQYATGPTFQYIGAPDVKRTPDGYMSVGDMGSLDEEGYLFPADRRVDLIISGGANIYPAEVEAALGEHPDIADLVVIGVPDDDWGRRTHAVIQPTDFEAPPSVSSLDALCRSKLLAYKVPKSYEFVRELPREPTGKVRRSQLVAERTGVPLAAFQSPVPGPG
jgi:bile acid-coenzyme A ligase